MEIKALVSQMTLEEKAGLCSGTENCWAINSQAKEEDIQASLDLLYCLLYTSPSPRD